MKLTSLTYERPNGDQIIAECTGGNEYRLQVDNEDGTHEVTGTLGTTAAYLASRHVEDDPMCPYDGITAVYRAQLGGLIA